MLINIQKDVIHLPYRHPYSSANEFLSFFVFCFCSFHSVYFPFSCARTAVVDHMMPPYHHPSLLTLWARSIPQIQTIATNNVWIFFSIWSWLILLNTHSFRVSFSIHWLDITLLSHTHSHCNRTISEKATQTSGEQILRYIVFQFVFAFWE